jgi:hypothetical protein
MKRFVRSFVLALILVVGAGQTQAAPYTDHFDALIEDLQSRAGTLTNVNDRAEQKQLKTIQKVLGTLQNKASVSLATDIKMLGKISKALARAFPEEFVSSPGVISDDLEIALQGLSGDVQEIVDGVQTAIGELGVSACTAKAQKTLASASLLMDQTASAADFATAAKLLGSALKSALKAGAVAGNCAPNTGGGGNGDYIRATIRGDLNVDFSSLVAAASGSGSFMIIAGGDDALGGVGIAISVFSVTGSGTYPVGIGTNVSRLNPRATYFASSGTITFTTFDLVNKKIAGTFSFAASQQAPKGSGTITVSSGAFSFTDFSAD